MRNIILAKKHIILIGSGGHARSCVDVIEQHGQYCIDGFISNDESIPWTSAYSILGSDQELQLFWREEQSLLIAVGQINNYELRKSLYESAVSVGYELPSIVSPFAYVSPHAVIGCGSIVMHGAIINAGAQIGINTIVNSRALIEHDAIVGDHCHVSTGAIINGGTQIGHCSFVGSGATLLHGLNIPPQSFIKMGSIVKRNFTS